MRKEPRNEHGYPEGDMEILRGDLREVRKQLGKPDVEVWVLTQDGQNGLSSSVYWKSEDAYGTAVELYMEEYGEYMNSDLKEAIEAETDSAKAWAMMEEFSNMVGVPDAETIIEVEKVRII